MGVIQKALNAQVDQIPERVLRKLIERKLKEAGSAMPPEGVTAFVQHLLAGSSSNFIWDDGGDGEGDSHHTIEINDADLEEIERNVGTLTEAIPEVISNVTTKAARLLAKSLRARWDVEGALQAYEIDTFRENLEERWGDAFELLRILLTICREIGSDALKRHNRSKSKRSRFRWFVLIRLQARACQVAEEIITLMENGFADGAMARWRTLHEIAVITAIVEDGDEALAERYILHDVVDVKREVDEYEKSRVPLGYAPHSKAVKARVERQYADALKRFGDQFKTDYGWAAPIVKGKPTFKSLQELAGRSGMTSYYKLASYNVHVGARSMFHRLSDIGSDEVLLAGRSNAGLVEPGQNLAYTLVQITSALTPKPNDMDRIIQHQAVVEIRDAIPKALAKADRKLRKDEAEFQQSRARSRQTRSKSKR